MTTDNTTELPSADLVKVDEGDYDRISQFILAQDFDAALGVQTELMAVSIRKPKKTEWFRAHPDFSRPMFILKVDDGQSRGEIYCLTPDVARAVPENATPAHLVLCVNRAGVPFFWPVLAPSDRDNTWRTSAVKVLMVARERWVRCVPNMSAGAYECKTTDENLPEPAFPDNPERLLGVALEKRGIASADHELIRHLLTGA